MKLLIVPLIFLASCSMFQKEVVKTKIIAFPVPCATPPDIEINLPDEEMTEDQLTEVHTTNYLLFEKTILYWKAYGQCVQRHNENVKKLEDQVK
jgi:hypothetical protein